MTLTTHAIVAITVTQWTGSPLLGFVMGAISHYLTDAIPHGDEWLYWRHVYNNKDRMALIAATTDTICLVSVSFFVLLSDLPVTTSVVVAAVIGAILPDIFITLHTSHRSSLDQPQSSPVKRWYFHLLQLHYRFHMFCHNITHVPIRYRSAIGYQVIIMGVFFYWILTLTQ